MSDFISDANVRLSNFGPKSDFGARLYCRLVMDCYIINKKWNEFYNSKFFQIIMEIFQKNCWWDSDPLESLAKLILLSNSSEFLEDLKISKMFTQYIQNFQAQRLFPFINYYRQSIKISFRNKYAENTCPTHLARAYVTKVNVQLCPDATESDVGK